MPDGTGDFSKNEISTPSPEKSIFKIPRRFNTYPRIPARDNTTITDKKLPLDTKITTDHNTSPTAETRMIVGVGNIFVSFQDDNKSIIAFLETSGIVLDHDPLYEYHLG